MKKRKKQISQSKYPQLHQVQKQLENKNLDDVAELMWTIYTNYGLTMDEVAALNFYLMKNALIQKQNKEFLKEKFGLKIDELNPEGIFQVQQALLAAHSEKHKSG